MRRNLLIVVVLLGSLTLTFSSMGAITLYAPFDGNPDAKIAAGNAKGTVVGAPAYEKGMAGDALVLGGADAVGFETAKHINPAAGTVMFWVKLGKDSSTLTAQQEFMSIYVDNDNRRRLHLDQNDHGIHWFHKVAGKSGMAKKEEIAWKAGDWHHMIASWQQGKPLILQLDDEKIEGGESDLLDPMPKLFHVGSYKGTGSFLQGTIDEFYVFDEYGVTEEPTASVDSVNKLATTWGSVKDRY